jgi:hypothetical protein
MLRQTEELVMEARLELIAREHRSMGAALDTRCLYPLVEVSYHSIRKSMRQDIEKRLQGRRGGKADSDIKLKSNLVVEAHNDGVTLPTFSGNYELEESTWKAKASKGVYSERRKLQYPELDAFLKSMSSSLLAVYHERVRDRFQQLVEKYRKECLDLKAEMDSNGIFHPEANVQRVHCIYLMKLEKGITSMNIEDPVLKQMYQEEYERQRQELEVQITKKQMLRDLEDRERQGASRRPLTDSPKVSVGEQEDNEATEVAENLFSMMNIVNGDGDGEETDSTALRPTKRKAEQTELDDAAMKAEIEALTKTLMTLKPFQERGEWDEKVLTMVANGLPCYCFFFF